MIADAEKKLQMLEEEQERQREQQQLEEQKIQKEKEALIKRENERYVNLMS